MIRSPWPFSNVKKKSLGVSNSTASTYRKLRKKMISKHSGTKLSSQRKLFLLITGTNSSRRKSDKSTAKLTILITSVISSAWKRRRSVNRKSKAQEHGICKFHHYFFFSIRVFFTGNPEFMIILIYSKHSIMNIDWKYQLWKAGVTITDNVSHPFFINNQKILLFVYFYQNERIFGNEKICK